MKDIRINYTATYVVDMDYFNDFAQNYGYESLEDVLKNKAYRTLKRLVENYLNVDEVLESNEDLEPSREEIAREIFNKIKEQYLLDSQDD